MSIDERYLHLTLNDHTHEKRNVFIARSDFAQGANMGGKTRSNKIIIELVLG